MTLTYKVGDEVRIVGCPKLRYWGNWKKCVNKTGIITNKFGGYYFINKNEYYIDFTDEMLRPVKVTNWRERLQ